jgi:hypothetical protein
VSDLAPSFEHFYCANVHRLFTALCLVTALIGRRRPRGAETVEKR